MHYDLWALMGQFVFRRFSYTVNSVLNLCERSKMRARIKSSIRFSILLSFTHRIFNIPNLPNHNCGNHSDLHSSMNNCHLHLLTLSMYWKMRTTPPSVASGWSLKFEKVWKGFCTNDYFHSATINSSTISKKSDWTIRYSIKRNYLFLLDFLFSASRKKSRQASTLLPTKNCARAPPY